ncbi:LysR family transcriptional regulator [Tenacibaculum xiamenense]|uniref:LysR family transcriptional regulator n=1 Tax=Tenacibaculum xiamenense TaxID=1261553 RepID=UPI003893DBD5
MDTRLLRFFVSVYEQKNLTRAAEQCFVSQPNISHGIKTLEGELGKSLFVRHKKGVDATIEGHQFYPTVKRLLSELDLLSNLFENTEFKNKVVIGVANGLPQEHKQQFFRKATDLLKSVEWEINDISRKNDINLLVREWKYDEDIFLPLWKEDYVLCIPNGNPLLKKEVISIEDLKNEVFIHCPTCEAHQQCLSILNMGGHYTKTIANCSSKTETLTMLMAGLGVTFLPEWFVDGWYGFETRKFDGPRYFREVGLAYSRKSLKEQPITMLIEYFSKKSLKVNPFSKLGVYHKK